jgi:RimJ/RimL family protein N-acetyltransferase
MPEQYKQFTQIEGPRLRLMRLEEKHIPELAKNLISPTSWISATRGISTPALFNEQIQKFLKQQAQNDRLLVVAQEKETEKLVAMSIYHSSNPEFTRVEIGFTWIGDQWHRTFVNTELKYLMLSYAFENMGLKRVEFMVDPKNEKSNKAMRRIGGKLDGTLRKWRYVPEVDEGTRNVYSVIDDEWPEIKRHLKNLMERY